MYPIFEIFGRSVGSYAVCGFIGLFIAVAFATKISKNNKIEFEDIILMTLAIAAGILIGGHLLYALTNIDRIIKYTGLIIEKTRGDRLEFSYIKYVISECFGGMVFYGGFIGASVALIIYIKAAKITYKKEITDIFAMCIPLFHTFGRIGCFLGGCCYGVECSFGFIANNELLPEMSGIRRLPISLIESLFNFLLFLFLLYLFKSKKQSGKLIFVYMIIYPVGRFIFEFFRGDKIRGIFLHLSTSQWISILLFVIGIIFIKNQKVVDKDWDGYKE